MEMEDIFCKVKSFYLYKIKDKLAYVETLPGETITYKVIASQSSEISDIQNFVFNRQNVLSSVNIPYILDDLISRRDFKYIDKDWVVSCIGILRNLYFDERKDFLNKILESQKNILNQDNWYDDFKSLCKNMKLLNRLRRYNPNSTTDRNIQLPQEPDRARLLHELYFKKYSVEETLVLKSTPQSIGKEQFSWGAVLMLMVGSVVTKSVCKSISDKKQFLEIDKGTLHGK